MVCFTSLIVVATVLLSVNALDRRSTLKFKHANNKVSLLIQMALGSYKLDSGRGGVEAAPLVHVVQFRHHVERDMVSQQRAIGGIQL